jgi:hypothetical protein
MANVLVELIDVWDRVGMAPAAIVDLGGESMIGLKAARAHGPSSGIELDFEVAQLLTLKRGLVVHERGFLRWDDALRAAGLDPSALGLPTR